MVLFNDSNSKKIDLYLFHISIAQVAIDERDRLASRIVEDGEPQDHWRGGEGRGGEL